MVIFDFFKEYLGEGFALLIGGFISWLFEKRKQRAALTSDEIENGSSVVKLYKDALDDLPLRYESKFTELNELFRQKVEILKEEIEFLKRERDLWKKKYNELYKEYQKYKKEHP